MKNRTRIGAVAYLNTKPLVPGLDRGLGAERVELSYDVPARLADRMRRGELDVGLLPVIELARDTELEIVPGLGIVTRGDTRSVLLVARRDVREVDTVALDPESRTSNALVRLLFDRVWERNPSFVPGSADLDSTLAGADAAVRIGDKALFEPVPDGCRVYDLGREWTDHFDLPFVFAVWAARPGVVDRELYRILHESRRQGMACIEEIAREYVWNGVRRPELARDYLEHNILSRLGSPELDALRLFLDGAARLGLIARAPTLRLALQRPTECHERAQQPA